MDASTLPAVKIQYAALPWRKVNGALQVLLITTRTTKRWIVPKGWPMEGRTTRESIAQEALEEAGLLGEVAAKPLGWFRYNKLRKSGEVVPCRVSVYAMKVARQRRTWLEKSVRQTRWCSPQEAMAHVTEPGLRLIIDRFCRCGGRKRPGHVTAIPMS